MSKGYRFEMWVCDRCNTRGSSTATAEPHERHPAGWRAEGNQHPAINRFDPNHPDKIKGFYWTVNWDALRAHLGRPTAAVERPESAVSPTGTENTSPRSPQLSRHEIEASA